MKELHRLPPLPQGQTSAQARYLTTSTTAAQRLRAVGPLGREGAQTAVLRLVGSGVSRVRRPGLRPTGKRPVVLVDPQSDAAGCAIVRPSSGWIERARSVS